MDLIRLTNSGFTAPSMTDLLKPWRLLDCLWGTGEQGVSIDDAQLHVYGGGEAETKMVSLKKNLARQLDRKNCPAGVRIKNGRIYLEVFNQE